MSNWAWSSGRAGAEPLSLLRFAVSGIDNLCHALETNLDHLFTGDDLEVYVDCLDGRFHCRSRYYNDFFYYVHLVNQRLSVDEVTARERRKMVFLRRKFLENLKDGRRIFVRKGSDPLRGLRRLHRALRLHGPHPLLCVNVADADHPVGTVLRLEPGLFRGFVSYFVACNRQEPYDVAGWLKTCRTTYRMANDAGSVADIRGGRGMAMRRYVSKRAALLHQSRKTCDGSPVAIRVLADVLIANGAYVEADDLLSEAMSVHPDDPGLVKAYAQSAHSSARYAPAIVRWNHAMSLNRHDPMCFAGFACNLREHGALDRAQDVIASALAIFPEDLVVLSEAARIADVTRRPADAMALWDKAIALHGPHPEWIEGRERARGSLPPA